MAWELLFKTDEGMLSILVTAIALLLSLGFSRYIRRQVAAASKSEE